MSRIGVFFALYLAIATAGWAADPNRTATPWWQTGYFGGYLEYGRLKIGRAFDTNTGPVGTLKDVDLSAGAVLGYSAALDDAQKWMAGLEIDLHWPGISDDLNGIAFIPDDEATAPSATSLNGCLTGALRFRAGYATSHQTLFYGAAGPALLCLDLSGGVFGFTPAREKVTLWGVQAGGGIEHWFTQWIASRAEVLYSWYDRKSISLGATQVLRLKPHGLAARGYLVIKLP